MNQDNGIYFDPISINQWARSFFTVPEISPWDVNLHLKASLWKKLQIGWVKFIFC